MSDMDSSTERRYDEEASESSQQDFSDDENGFQMKEGEADSKNSSKNGTKATDATSFHDTAVSAPEGAPEDVSSEGEEEIGESETSEGEERRYEQQEFASPRQSLKSPEEEASHTPTGSEISSEVEQLSPTTSRLASFTSGLGQRFSSNNGQDSLNNSESNGNDSESNGNDFSKAAEDNQTDEEAEPEEAPEKFPDEPKEEPFEDEEWPVETKQTAIETIKPALNKELSSNWMKFEDEAWDSSKPSSSNVDAPEKDNNGKVFQTELSRVPESGNKSVGSNRSNPASMTGKKGPLSPRRANGSGAPPNVAFWEDGVSDEDDAVDDAAIGKALEHSPKQGSLNANESGGLSKTSSGTNKHEENQGEKGWAGKMIGGALGFVAQKLPFSRDNDSDMNEDNVVEADDDMPEFHDKPKNVEASGLMQDYSALSADSGAGHHRYDGSFEQRARENAVPEEHMGIEHGSTTGFNVDGGDLFDQAGVMTKSKEAQAAENRIKFAKIVDNNPTMPLFDFFIDMPHPATEGANVQPAVFIGSPSDEEFDKHIEDDIQNSMEQIACLAFPEYDRSISQASDESTSVKQSYEKQMLEATGFQHHTFTLTLQSGSLVYGHVRRYLPTHDDALFRYDAGRRPGRALIIFSRFPGGDDFFASILKTLDAISCQHRAALQYRTTRPQKWFLQALYQKHNRMCCNYATNFDERRGAPHIITIQGLEYADCMEQFASVDATHYYVPTCLLHKPLIPEMKTSFTCSILPILRCLGVANSMRLLSALLSERRVVLVSVSPTRLDRSARAAMSMLAQGMLRWNHMCIPVLPPDLWSCLKAPSPYLIGILAPLAYRLELTDKLGEVMVVDLDENKITPMGMTAAEMSKGIPDLCRSMSEAMLAKRRIAMPETLATEQDMKELAILNSTSDFLAQDLCEIVKADKQTMNGTALAARHMARKATKAVKSTLKYFLGGKKGVADDEEDEEQPFESIEVKKSRRERRKEPSAVFIEGCRNEAGEEAVELAFASFFVRMLGNTSGFLTGEQGSKPPGFNKELFLKERKDRGDGPGTPMWNMLLNFCETQLMDRFVQDREELIRKRQPMPLDAPLFWRCIDYHVFRDIDFGILHVRSVTRKMLQRTSVQQMLPSNVRRLAMAITSKRKFEGNLGDATADLAELSRECSGALYDVMSVIWLRMRDSKGLQWVHGYQAMRVLKEVLLHGPITAVADATDGIDLIRVLAHRETKGYDYIQVEAREVYNLLVDRSRLFLRRRMAGEKRRIAYHDLDDSEFHRDTRLNLKSAFKEMHEAMNPNARVQEGQRRRTSLSSRRTSLSSRLPHRLSISKHIRALEPMEDSMSSFPAVLPALESRANRHKDLVHDTLHRAEGDNAGASVNGELAVARRIVREYTRKVAEEDKNKAREAVVRRDNNQMGVELLRKQFMLLKVALYLTPVFYFFGNHEHFLSIIMFLWLSQQFQVFRAPVDSGRGY